MGVPGDGRSAPAAGIFWGVASVSNVTVTPGRVGDSLTITYWVLGVKFEVPSRIEEWEENRRIVASLGGVFPGVVTTTVAPEGADARVTPRFDYGVKGGVAGKVLNSFLVERLNAKNAEWSLKKFKKVCEGG